MRQASRERGEPRPRRLSILRPTVESLQMCKHNRDVGPDSDAAAITASIGSLNMSAQDCTNKADYQQETTLMFTQLSHHPPFESVHRPSARRVENRNHSQWPSSPIIESIEYTLLPSTPMSSQRAAAADPMELHEYELMMNRSQAPSPEDRSGVLRDQWSDLITYDIDDLVQTAILTQQKAILTRYQLLTCNTRCSIAG